MGVVPVPVICFLIAGMVVALIFCGAFFVELFFPNKKENSVNNEVNEEKSISDFDIDEMLSKLEEKTSTQEEIKEEKLVQPIISKAVMEEKAVTEEAEKTEEIDFDALFKQLEEEAKLAEAQEELNAEELATVVENETHEEIKEEPVVVEEVKPIVIGPEFDYNVRIQTINESLVRLEKDLAKASREVNKYEKTLARKERNEKLLDRKSAELTNLNLVLYNVNNLEDIDPEKKKKQEDLVEHISELKSSIKGAEEFLATNQEKYLNSKKIKDFLTGEKTRYNEEITELENLIKAGKNN